jgi:hypothetical protein
VLPLLLFCLPLSRPFVFPRFYPQRTLMVWTAIPSGRVADAKDRRAPGILAGAVRPSAAGDGRCQAALLGAAHRFPARPGDDSACSEDSTLILAGANVDARRPQEAIPGAVGGDDDGTTAEAAAAGLKAMPPLRARKNRDDIIAGKVRLPAVLSRFPSSLAAFFSLCVCNCCCCYCL